MHTHLDFDGDKQPDIGDFVLAKLVAENSANSYHCVAEVSLLLVFFGSQGNALDNSSNQPLMTVPILTGMVLSCACRPKCKWGTKRAQSILTFSMDLTGFNCE